MTDKQQQQMFNWRYAEILLGVEGDTAFYKKRDHIQIIADILCICRNPQTKSYIRRQTYVSYVVLQNCIKQLMMRKWLEPTKEDSGQTRLATTDKGLVFLQKYLELQELMGLRSMPKLKMAGSPVQMVLVKSR